MIFKLCYTLFILLISAATLAAEKSEPLDLSGYIKSRYQAGERDIILPDGDVRCRGTVTLGTDIKHLTIRGGRNTRLICTKLVALFYLNGCDDVTLRDFSVDYDPLPFTQGTITAIDREKKTIRYRIHDGYPRLSQTYLVRHPMFFRSSDRKMSYDAKLCFCQSNRMLSPEEGELAFSANRDDVKVGDMVVLNFRQDCALKVRGMADSLKFIGLTLYSGPAGIIARRVKGRHEIRNCRMIRGPRPPGAAEDRLLSLSADAINYAAGRHGPLIEGNEVEFIGDDSVNLHGIPFTVIRPEPKSNSFLCATTQGRQEYLELLRAGDRIRLLAQNNYAILGTATIRKIELAEDLPDVDPRQLYKAASNSGRVVYRIFVDGPLPEPWTLVDFPAINLPDFEIRDNHFHDHRARGMRIMAGSGLIENNRIERLEHQAISLGPEYGYWMEAGWVEDITVRGNKIESVCQGGSSYRSISYSLGAICTFVHNENGDFGIWPGNRGVRIENNRIHDCALAGIHLLASDGAVVRNNVISRVNWGDSSEAGKNFGIHYRKEAIGTVGSRNAVIENNRVEP